VVQLSDVSRSRECDDEDKKGEIRRAANRAVGTLRSVPPSPFPRLMSAVYRHKSAGLWIQMSSHGAHSLFHLETGWSTEDPRDKSGVVADLGPEAAERF
jgi:hypothetical protein